MGTGVSASVGFDGSINEAQYAVAAAPLNRGHVEGCAATAGAGTREVTIASGVVRALGGYHTVSGATVTLAENTSGQVRYDRIVLRIDYSSNDAALTVITGTPGGSDPEMTQTAGTTWDVSLAVVRVASGAGALSDGVVYDRRVGLWTPRTPSSPWSNFGGNYAGLAIRQCPNGDVELRGMVTTTSTITSPEAQEFITLPTQWRPAARELFTVTARENATSRLDARVDVNTDGRVFVVNPSNTTGTRWYSLGKIRFTPEGI